MKKAPIDRLLGQAGERVMCKKFSPDVSVHWFKANAKPGDRCLCGEAVKARARRSARSRAS